METIDNRELLQKKVLNEITFRYVIAVALLAVLAFLSFSINQSLHKRMREDFKTINLSGRQRMLSQRIALLSNRNEPQLLRETIAEFKTGEEFLIRSRFVGTEYKHLHDLYKGVEGIEVLAKQYIVLASEKSLTPETQEKVFQLSQIVLKKYDEATLLTQQVSEQEFNEWLLMEIVVLAATLIVLALVVLLIFRPMVEKVGSGFNQLNKIEEKSLANARLALIGEIASGIGHEIKNPLSVIVTMSEKLMGSETTKENKMVFGLMNKCALRINKIVHSLSVQSRESSRDEMKPAHLESIINDSVDVLASKIKYSNINITKNLNFNGDILCRQYAISQVITNLLSNAIDALSTTEGEKQITIESGTLDDGIYLRVRDTGPGVPNELVDKIFESFVTTKESGKGTGLGLSISRKIMLEHGGLLALNTHISNSCFEMKFPSDHIVH